MANIETVSIDVTLAFKYKKKGTSFMSKVICWWTKSRFFHVELIIGSKWISSNSDEGGVTIKDLKPLNDNWEYLQLPKIHLTKEQYDKIMMWINSQSGKKYDWTAIFLSTFLPLRWQSDNKWFCSEIVTTILKFMLVSEVINSDPGRITPGGLAKKFNKE